MLLMKLSGEFSYDCSPAVGFRTEKEGEGELMVLDDILRTGRCRISRWRSQIAKKAAFC